MFQFTLELEASLIKGIRAIYFCKPTWRTWHHQRFQQQQQFTRFDLPSPTFTQSLLHQIFLEVHIPIHASYVWVSKLPCYQQALDAICNNNNNISRSIENDTQLTILASSLTRQLALGVSSSTKHVYVVLVQLQPLQPVPAFPHYINTEDYIDAMQTTDSNNSEARSGNGGETLKRNENQNNANTNFSKIELTPSYTNTLPLMHSISTK